MSPSIFDKLKPTAGNTTGTGVQSGTAAGTKKTFAFSALPESLAQMQALPEAQLRDPFQTAALTVCALCAYAADKNIGTEMLNWLRGPRPLSRYEEQFLWDRLYDKLYLPKVYCEGAVPGNDYTPAQPVCITVYDDPRPQDVQQGYMRLYLKTAGADSPRAVTLRQKASTGEWFLWDYPAVMMGVRTPVSQDPWA